MADSEAKGESDVVFAPYLLGPTPSLASVLIKGDAHRATAGGRWSFVGPERFMIMASAGDAG
jgi:hypothetical protein